MAHLLSLPIPKPLLFPPQTIGTRVASNRARVSACGCNRGLKELSEGRTIRVSDSMKELDLSLLLLSDPVLHGGGAAAASVEQQEKKRDLGDDDKQEYYVNMGYAIRTLREEFPDVFVKEPSFDIYRDDIVFEDPFNTFMGIRNYKRIFWSLRFVGNIFFKAVWVDIVSVWQPVKNVVLIRWIVHGIPRVPWEVRGRFDGISEYKLDKKGKIYGHRVFNIAPKPPMKFRVPSVDELMQSLGCPSTANPTYFETSLSSVASSMPFLLGITCASYYLAFHLILALRRTAEG
ncbi:uncharacterized protein M6B38_148550 [Iris pallida]|uniref:Uncharacterized protein n=1 Tax=Iris pallida TaxID=29817 RepID=A0AAX6DR76_IRIPA|nr:uncharacterized protein M6B38_231570 [Iris pallida]KAJ6812616.1 uncharacterized protein M6B38_148550 [Iris pallida]